MMEGGHGRSWGTYVGLGLSFRSWFADHEEYSMSELHHSRTRAHLPSPPL